MEPGAAPASDDSSPRMMDPSRLGLDPLFWCNAKMFARTLLDLPGFQNVPGSTQLQGRPIRSVQLMGCVVRLQFDHTMKAAFILDDGTALLHCIWWKDGFERRHGTECEWFGPKPEGSDKPAGPFKLGDQVKVCGQLRQYMGEVQLRVDAATVETDPNSEALWTAEVIHLMTTCYCPKGAGGGGQKRRIPDGVPSSQAPRDTPPDSLTDTLRSFVRCREEFSFEELLDAKSAPELHAAYTEFVEANAVVSDAVPTPTTATHKVHVFTRCIAKLAGEGFVYLRDPDKDVYGCVSMRLVEGALMDVFKASEARNAEYGEDGVPREEVADGLIRHDSLSGACLTRSQAFRHITAAVAESILFDANYRRLKRLNL